MFILAALAYPVLGEEKERPEPSSSSFSPERFRRMVNAEVVSGLGFCVSALPFFWVPTTIGGSPRYDMWYFVFLVFFLVLGRARAPDSRSGISEPSTGRRRIGSWGRAFRLVVL